MGGNGTAEDNANDEQEGERSHMYETGEQSDAIRSIRSKTCQTPPTEKDTSEVTETVDKTQMHTAA